MVKKYLYGLPLVLLIIASLLTSCSSETVTVSETTTATKTTTVAPSNGGSTETATTTSAAESNWWDKFGTPQYGGKLNLRATSLGTTSFDPYVVNGMQGYLWEYDTLFINSWTTDRDTWSFKSGYIPVEYTQPLLAESWEMIDEVTISVKLREGICWQDKAPVNGREITAEDVQYSFDRLLGAGSGFTTPSFRAQMEVPNLERAVVTGKYTVEFQFKSPSVINIEEIVEGGSLIVAKEWVEQGDLQNWENVVGSSAWMVTDYVSANSLTFSRNPDYWGYDERYSENSLPYLDELRVVEIIDDSTALAALRTGKVDVDPVTIQQYETVKTNNTDINLSYCPGPTFTLDLRCDVEPFTDIKVRKAMQMAINVKDIAQSLYGGITDGVCCGLISPELKGYAYSQDQWSDTLKAEYSYNPTEAKQLLAEAGYPEGFETNFVTSSGYNTALMEIVKAYLQDVDIDCSINMLDPSAVQAYLNAGKHDQMCMTNKTGSNGNPQSALLLRYSKGTMNWSKVNDSYFDGLYEEYIASTSSDEGKQVCATADKYSLEQHWSICLGSSLDPIAWQSWVKGYNGELLVMGTAPGFYFSRCWIDQTLKQ